MKLRWHFDRQNLKDLPREDCSQHMGKEKEVSDPLGDEARTIVSDKGDAL